jgi:putative transposase
MDVPNHHRGVSRDAAVLIPDHLHAIVLLSGELIAPCSLSRDLEAERYCSPNISAVIGSFKLACSKEAGRALWQRGFYDHIIRSEAELNQIRKYIEGNEDSWRARQASPLPGPRDL